jgi:hypothetical protein
MIATAKRRPTQQPKALVWAAEGLNEYDALIQTGKDVPNHTPASPGYWFAGLARDLRNLKDAPTWLALLTPTAKRRFMAIISTTERTPIGHIQRILHEPYPLEVTM